MILVVLAIALFSTWLAFAFLREVFRRAAPFLNPEDPFTRKKMPTRQRGSHPAPAGPDPSLEWSALDEYQLNRLLNGPSA